MLKCCWLCAQAEALSKKRGITWRDRMGLSSAPLASSSKEGPLEVASRERSYQGSLPDVHEEVCSQQLWWLEGVKCKVL